MVGKLGLGLGLDGFYYLGSETSEKRLKIAENYWVRSDHGGDEEAAFLMKMVAVEMISSCC